MKPRKKYEPEYRFGGNPAQFYVSPLLGTKNAYTAVIKVPKPRRKKK